MKHNTNAGYSISFSPVSAELPITKTMKILSISQEQDFDPRAESHFFVTSQIKNAYDGVGGAA